MSMTKQDIQMIAKVVQKIVQIEVAKSNKKLLSEIASVRNAATPLYEKTQPRVNKPIVSNSNTPTLDMIREMVGSAVLENDYDDDGFMPPTVHANDPTNVFMKDYSTTLKRMEEAVLPFRETI